MSVPGLLHELTRDPGLCQACPFHMVHMDAAKCQHLTHLMAVINWCHTLMQVLAKQLSSAS
jgi:hypothetical protein